MSKDFIYQFWEGEAQEDKEIVSWKLGGDVQIMDLEILGIKKFIQPGFSVLDAGCANGYSTEKMFDDDSRNHLTAFDYIPAMAEKAQERLEKRARQHLVYKVYQADVRKIPEKDNSFDLAFTIRVIINLPTWEEQLLGINELLRVVKPGGTLILSEGFWGSLQKLNAIRAVAGLRALVEDDYNRYIKEWRLESFLEESGLSFEVEVFSSLYYLGTRLIRELTPGLPTGFDKPINKDFFELSGKYSGGDFGIQKRYIIRKS